MNALEISNDEIENIPTMLELDLITQAQIDVAILKNKKIKLITNPNSSDYEYIGTRSNKIGQISPSFSRYIHFENYNYDFVKNDNEFGFKDVFLVVESLNIRVHIGYSFPAGEAFIISSIVDEIIEDHSLIGYK